MAVILRMARHGTKKRPFYHIVAADSRHKRDGRFLEQLGSYDPLAATQLKVDADKAKKWLAAGAQTSPVVKQLLKRAGVQ
ncbi:MAG TPA: 30S ribosomal protein S16 [Myxococcota bacterium]|nr:30S ribosomal protein S16 [Myxococcota bacterium]